MRGVYLTKAYALRLLRTGRAKNPGRLRPDARGSVPVAIDVYYRCRGWIVRHYLE